MEISTEYLTPQYKVQFRYGKPSGVKIQGKEHFDKSPNHANTVSSAEPEARGGAPAPAHDPYLSPNWTRGSNGAQG
ncbi:unnamed protein product [Arctia plantaginis]|uniref:Uncharacterized protein n=1 Tax=Arctia plantaginis TaxID=874455 RepID=A0A8S1AW39_ARCPL|nr:unnamed protein product [Arctia plantaginis]